MIAFFLSPLGRWLGGAAVALVLVGGIWLHGFNKGKDHVQAKWDAAVQRAIERGEKARTDAERDVGAEPADGVRDDKFNRD